MTPSLKTQNTDKPILYINEEDPSNRWRDALMPLLPEVDFNRDFYIWPDGMRGLENPKDIDIAIVWRPDPGVLKKFENLKAVINLGAGVDAILADSTYPKTVPLVRLIDPALSRHMCEFIIHRVLHFHRKFHIYEKMQRDHIWKELVQDDTLNKSVGILGLGKLGSYVAKSLIPFGFKISGWSRTKKNIKGVQSFHGIENLQRFLKSTNILICLLPLTPQTRGILNFETLSYLPKGAFVINSGRGPQIVENDLILTLNNNHIAGVALDVFCTEPLPIDNPLWDHPKVIITPHIASMSSPKSAAVSIAKNIRLIRSGKQPGPLVNLQLGY